ncbi:MAG: hypothetical protein ACRBDI_04365 [Alphaproteobacteria bacterium]
MKMTIISKGKRRSPLGGWTRERRAAAAARCRAHKPSRFATGPRTRSGKAAIRLNALKGGAYARHWRDLYRAMLRQRDFINEISGLQEVRHGEQSKILTRQSTLQSGLLRSFTE